MILRFALLLLISGTALGAEQAPMQFAHGFPIITTESAPVYRLVLEEEVYRSSQHAGLGDIRVFNAAGEPLPHSLRRPAHAEAAPTAAVALAFYPLYGSGARGAGAGVQIAIGSDGSLIDMQTPGAAGERLEAWLVDSAALAGTLTALELEWPQVARGFVAGVNVAASDDLQEWVPAGRATLADLDHAGQRLVQRQIPLARPGGRYLRIEWPADQGATLLSAVRAQSAAPSTERELRWTRLNGVREDAAAPTFVFDARAALPSERVRVLLPQPNTLVQLRWFSRARSDWPWQDQGGGPAYRLELDGNDLASTERSHGLRRDRYWRLAVEDGDAAGLGAEPGIELGWEPDELLFVARGAGPYTLAVGRHAVTEPGAGVETLLAGIDSEGRAALLGLATLGPRQTLGGDAALIAPRPPLPWQRYLLWAVLLAAVALLGRMAWGLYREMNRGGARDDAREQ